MVLNHTSEVCRRRNTTSEVMGVERGFWRGFLEFPFDHTSEVCRRRNTTSELRGARSDLWEEMGMGTGTRGLGSGEGCSRTSPMLNWNATPLFLSTFLYITRRG